MSAINHTDILRKRLYYQSWHRGTREADLLLGGFANMYLSDFNEEALREFEALLGCSDTDIFDWLQNSILPPLLSNNAIAERFYEWVKYVQTLKIDSKDFKNSGRRPSGEPDEHSGLCDRGRVPKVNAPET